VTTTGAFGVKGDLARRQHSALDAVDLGDELAGGTAPITLITGTSVPSRKAAAVNFSAPLNPRPSPKLLTALSVLSRERDPTITGRALLALEPGLGCSLACADGASMITERFPESPVEAGLTEVLW